MRIATSPRKRECHECKKTLPKGTKYMLIWVHSKSRAFCFECMYINTMKLAKHHDVSAVQVKLFEQEI